MTDAFKNDSGFIRGPFAKFSREDGSAAAVTDKNFQLSPSGPVAAEDLVQPDGRCAAPVAQATATPQPAAQPIAAPASADGPVGSAAGDLAGAPLIGGVALGMSECETVRRAGLASNVNIAVGDKGERKVVLTYLEGNWPGVYTFSAGRLKEIAAAPVQPKSAKRTPPKKKQPKRAVRPSPSAPVTQIR